MQYNIFLDWFILWKNQKSFPVEWIMFKSRDINRKFQGSILEWRVNFSTQKDTVELDNLSMCS